LNPRHADFQGVSGSSAEIPGERLNHFLHTLTICRRVAQHQPVPYNNVEFRYYSGTDRQEESTRHLALGL